jgi:hypothetical protein
LTSSSSSSSHQTQQVPVSSKSSGVRLRLQLPLMMLRPRVLLLVLPLVHRLQVYQCRLQRELLQQQMVQFLGLLLQLRASLRLLLPLLKVHHYQQQLSQG